MKLITIIYLLIFSQCAYSEPWIKNNSISCNMDDSNNYDKATSKDVTLLGSQIFLEDTLPSDLPLPIVDTLNNPAPGGIYLSPFGPSVQSGEYKNYLMILDTACNVVSYKLVPDQDKGYIGYHFKPVSNGMLSYLARKMDGYIYLTDTSYNVITSFKDSTNPYNRIRYYAYFDLLPNGSYLTARYDFQYVDLSKYFPNGEPNGAVLQAIIQELDKDKNVVFQWRSLDYNPVNQTLNPVTPAIDYFHPNSMVFDNDGNLLIAARDLGAILKIDRNTGEILWTLGGKKNEFEFIGENEANAPYYFSYQHDIRRLLNGNITLFDNGRQHEPQYSRAVEYNLDEANKKCTLVWEYRHNPDFFADQHGSTQRLPNGNTLIAWGTYSMDGGTALTELHTDNSIALEMHFPTGLESQFIYKYPWPTCPLIASAKKKELLELNTYDFNDDKNKTGLSITFNKLDAYIYNELVVDKYDCSPLNPEFEGRPPIVSPYRFLLKPKMFYSMEAEIHISLSEYPLAFQPEKSILYSRPIEGNGLFKPLQTNYDPEKNELVAIADTTGEFIISYPDEPVISLPPFLLAPSNDEKPNVNVPVLFSWNPRGYFKQSNIQVATDTNFTDIVLDSTLIVISMNSSEFTLGNKYYWRVRTSNEAGTGNWSEIRSFTMSEPYISMQMPNGGEVWDTTSHIIRWDYNIKDSINASFKIELYRNGSPVSVIQANKFSAVNAFKWKIPSNTPEDSTYQIKVTSISNPELSSMSTNYFTIKNPTTGVEYDGNSIDESRLICFPNPVSNKATIEFKVNEITRTVLKAYNSLGECAGTIFNDMLIPGFYYLDWKVDGMTPGVYYLRLDAGFKTVTRKVVVIK